MASYGHDILQRVLRNSVSVGGGCRIWIKGPYNRLAYPYGSMRLKWPRPDDSSIVMYVHRLVYLVNNNMETLPEGVEVSHRCHNSRCVAIDHLVAEPRATNADRQKCRRHSQGTSSLEQACPHNPKCIVVVNYLDLYLNYLFEMLILSIFGRLGKKLHYFGVSQHLKRYIA